MELGIKDLFNNEIVKAGAYVFDITIEQLTYIGAWQNFIYEYEKNGVCYILRFTPSTHRTEEMVKGELDWVLFLANNGLSVSRPIPSKQGGWTEVILLDSAIYFTVSSFVKAEGKKIGYPECLNDTELYKNLGHITGKMHALSKQYKPTDRSIRRHDWNNNYYLQNIDKFVPVGQNLVYEGYRKLMEKIKTTLPQDKSCYGLIHGDINVNNYLVDARKGITLFDFDEAQYSWFLEDIAIPLYYLVYVYGGEEGKKDREDMTSRFMDHFLRGYVQENALDDYWLKQIPLFLQLREIIVYAGMHRSSDISKLDQWGLDYISQSRSRIENGQPIVNVWE